MNIWYAVCLNKKKPLLNLLVCKYTNLCHIIWFANIQTFATSSGLQMPNFFLIFSFAFSASGIPSLHGSEGIGTIMSQKSLSKDLATTLYVEPLNITIKVNKGREISPDQIGVDKIRTNTLNNHSRLCKVYLVLQEQNGG